VEELNFAVDEFVPPGRTLEEVLPRSTARGAGKIVEKTLNLVRFASPAKLFTLAMLTLELPVPPAVKFTNSGYAEMPSPGAVDRTLTKTNVV
jgi:hypothetical protein